MRKIMFTLTLFLISLIAWPARAGMDTAVSYLNNQPVDDWSAMALAAAGQKNISTDNFLTFTGNSATDYAKRILALVAVGQNPSNFNEQNLVAELKNLTQDGQIGSPDLLNDDAWGILALSSAGVSAGDPVMVASRNFLLSHQQTDGGWGWGVESTSDTNDTAAVVMALLASGSSSGSTAIARAVDYFHTTQKDDGGWAYEPVWDSDTASTSWVVSALNKLGQPLSEWKKSDITPADFLWSLQTSDGSFKWTAGDSSGSASMTSFAVIALAGKSFPVWTISSSSGRRVEKADVLVRVSPENLSGEVGSQLVYKIIIENKGPDPAVALYIKNLVPTGVESEVKVNGGFFNPLDNLWSRSQLLAGASQEAIVTLVLPPEAGNLTWNIKAETLREDDNLINNEAAITVQVFPATVVGSASVIAPAPAGQVLGESISVCDFSFSNNLTSTNNLGFILRDDANGPIWYYDPVSQQRYCLPDETVAYRALGFFGLGITNENLDKLPIAGQTITAAALSEANQKLINRLRGRILLQVESFGEAWYVDPRDGYRHYLANGWSALKTLTDLSVKVTGNCLAGIPAAPQL